MSLERSRRVLRDASDLVLLRPSWPEIRFSDAFLFGGLARLRKVAATRARCRWKGLDLPFRMTPGSRFYDLRGPSYVDSKFYCLERVFSQVQPLEPFTKSVSRKLYTSTPNGLKRVEKAFLGERICTFPLREILQTFTKLHPGVHFRTEARIDSKPSPSCSATSKLYK